MTENNDDVTEEIERLADEFVEQLRPLLIGEDTAFDVFIYDNGWGYDKRKNSRLLSPIKKLLALTEKEDDQEILETIRYLMDYLMDDSDMEFDDLLYEVLDLRKYHLDF